MVLSLQGACTQPLPAALPVPLLLCRPVTSALPGAGAPHRPPLPFLTQNPFSEPHTLPCPFQPQSCDWRSGSRLPRRTGGCGRTARKGASGTIPGTALALLWAWGEEVRSEGWGRVRPRGRRTPPLRSPRCHQSVLANEGPAVERLPRERRPEFPQGRRVPPRQCQGQSNDSCSQKPRG